MPIKHKLCSNPNPIKFNDKNTFSKSVFSKPRRAWFPSDVQHELQGTFV